jgi:uncharacterized protein YdcH (DUF465 family)
MSDTPRTDAVYFKQGATMYDLANEMKLVEHELNAAKSKIELLMSANADVARIAGERDAAEKRIKRLEAVTNDPSALWINWLRGDVTLPVGIGDVRQYQDRIKRLEEENNELRAEEARLLNTNGELERGIKRLIDAGDAMFPWSERVGQEFWNKAKEAK